MCCNTPRTKHSPLSDMTSFAGCKWVAIAGEPATLTDLETTTRADVLDGDVAVGDLCCLTSGGGHPRNGAHDILRVRGVTRHTVTAAVVRVRRVATIVRRPALVLGGGPGGGPAAAPTRARPPGLFVGGGPGGMEACVYTLCVPADEVDEDIVFQRTRHGMVDRWFKLWRVARIPPMFHCRATGAMQFEFYALPAEDIAYAPEND